MVAKKKSSNQSANAAEKRAAQGRKTVSVTGFESVKTASGDTQTNRVNARVARTDLPMWDKRLTSANTANARGVVLRGDRKPLIQKAVKSTKSSVEVGRKQRAASGKKTTRKMK